MKIIRNIDGKSIEIELTDAEKFQIAREIDDYYYLEDLKMRYSIPSDKEQEAIDLFDHYLGNNDTYWEEYWLTASLVAKELNLKDITNND